MRSFIIDPTLSEEQTAALVAKFKTLGFLEQNAGTRCRVLRSGASASWPTRSMTGPKANMVPDVLHQRARVPQANWIKSSVLPTASCVFWIARKGE